MRRMRLIIKEPPQKGAGDTFTIDGEVIGIEVDREEAQIKLFIKGKEYVIGGGDQSDCLTIEVDAETVSETLTCANSYWEEVKE